ILFRHAGNLLPFKVLHGFFVFFGRGLGLECTEISALPRLRVFLPGIQTITALNFSNHGCFVSSTPTLPARVSTLNVFKSTLAGPLVTLPVRTSKQELCHGHCTLNPSNAPSDNGPKRCVQNS